MAKRRFAHKNADIPEEGEEILVDAVETKRSSGDWFEDNQKTIVGGLIGLALLIGLYFAYQNLIRKPAMVEASSSLYQAQFQFERDSFSAALTNPGGGHPGFLDIINNHGSTPAGNSAQYYAGISYLHLGNFNEAIGHLEDFSAKGDVLPIMKNGGLGDAYSELGDFDKAISYYEKACNSNNEFLTSQYLKKLGMLYEKQQNFNKALASYQKIKSDFPSSDAGIEVEKLIGRVSAVAN